MSNPISTLLNAPVQAILTVTDNGAPVTPTSISWGTSAPAIATVDQNGLVTPVAAGVTTITAQFTVTQSDGNPFTGTVDGTVTVVQQGDNFVATLDFQPVAAK